jgi:hypothetical protein
MIADSAVIPQPKPPPVTGPLRTRLTPTQPTSPPTDITRASSTSRTTNPARPPTQLEPPSDPGRFTLTFVSGLVRVHRRQIGSIWRTLNPGQQALLELVYLRKGEPFAEVGARFGICTTTCWRDVNDTVDLLATRAPKLRAALRQANRQGVALCDHRRHPHPDRPYHRRPALLLRQAQETRHEPAGHRLPRRHDPVGIRPTARQHTDTAAARIWNILAALRNAGLIAWATRATTATTKPDNTSSSRTKGATSPSPRRTLTAPTPGYAAPANAPTPDSNPGASCAKSAAAHAASADWPKPSTCYRTTSSPPDEALSPAPPDKPWWPPRVRRDPAPQCSTPDETDDR